jgi:hypothetical protein
MFASGEHGRTSPEFVGVVRRYGAAAAGMQAMIDAAAEGSDGHRRSDRRRMRDLQTIGKPIIGIGRQATTSSCPQVQRDTRHFRTAAEG